MSLVLGVLFAGLIGAQSPDPSPPVFQPPLFQPGAPGTASRTLTVAESVALSRTAFVEADVRFMQHMLVHHAQAVEMVALMPERAASDTVGRLGQRIALTQEAEIDLMRDWLLARAQPVEMAPVEMAMDHGHHGDHAADPDTAPMPGMLTPRQMQALAAASGPDFDRLFLDGMIQHHRGAIDMVTELNRHPDAAEDPMLSEFANAVVADQSAEILRMRTLSSDLSKPTLEEAP